MVTNVNYIISFKKNTDRVFATKIQDGSESKEDDNEADLLPPLVKHMLEKEEIGLVCTKLGRYKKVSTDCPTLSGVEASRFERERDVPFI